LGIDEGKRGKGINFKEREAAIGPLKEILLHSKPLCGREGVDNARWRQQKDSAVGGIYVTEVMTKKKGSEKA